MTMVINAFLSFAIGAVSYVSLEILFRGHSHISMAFAGGLCFLLLHMIFCRWEDIPLILKCTLCMILITAVEFFTGLIVNVWLKLGVWDYAEKPLNIMGQICPMFSALWFLMGIPISYLSELMKKLI